MKISGIKKSSLIDWPGKIVITLFTGGCNFRCPWCQNPELVFENVSNEVTIEYLKDYFEEHKSWIDGICITGGEPLIQKGIMDFLKEFKKKNVLIKLDTNGYNPLKLREIIRQNLIDYIAVDIKTALNGKYSESTGIETDVDLIKESIKIIMKSHIDYEFRTTVVPGLVDEEDIVKIGRDIAGAKMYILQNFRAGNTLDKKFSNIKPYSQDKINKMADIVSEYVQKVDVRV